MSEKKNLPHDIYLFNIMYVRSHFRRLGSYAHALCWLKRGKGLLPDMYTCFTCHAALSASEWQRWTCVGFRVPGPNRLPGTYNHEYLDVLGNWWHAHCSPCRIKQLEDEISDPREEITSCGRSLREAEFHVAQALEHTQ